MNGKRAKKLRKMASILSDNDEMGFNKKKKWHRKGFWVESTTRRWEDGSFMRIYRDMKKDYKPE